MMILGELFISFRFFFNFILSLLPGKMELLFPFIVILFFICLIAFCFIHYFMIFLALCFRFVSFKQQFKSCVLLFVAPWTVACGLQYNLGVLDFGFGLKVSILTNELVLFLLNFLFPLYGRVGLVVWL